MIKEKQQSKNWEIAVVYSVLVVSIFTVGSWIFAVIMNIFFDDLALDVADFIILLITMWLSVMYSTKFICEKYIIKNCHRVVAIATICLFIFSIVGLFAGLAADRPLEWSDFQYHFSITLYSIGLFINLIMFYILSKKYLK